MLADNTDYFSEDFLEIDITEEEELTDTEREAKWFGKTIRLDRNGKQYRRGKINRQEGGLLEVVEDNYKQGLIDVDTLVNFKLGMVADEEIR